MARVTTELENYRLLEKRIDALLWMKSRPIARQRSIQLSRDMRYRAKRLAPVIKIGAVK